MFDTKTIVFALLCLAVLGMLSCAYQPSFDGKVDETLKYAHEQLQRSVEAVQDSTKFPVNTDPETGEWLSSNLYGWTSGFFPGLLWYMWENTDDPAMLAAAKRWTNGLERVQYFTENHDTGFMMMCSYGNGLRLTGNQDYVPILLQTANSLATRYKPGAGLIQSWNANDRWMMPVIIDNMMNLELLFWAARNGGGKHLYEIAELHARNTIVTHVREDGSTWHVVDVNPETAEIRGKYTAQGYNDDSCWSRGQAWGIYGFTETYRETGEPIFLQTARRLADYWLDNIPEDYIPYSDFNAPNIPDESRDTSAAAIAASAFLELAGYGESDQTGERYRQAAIKTLESLCSETYLTRDIGSAGILKHATTRWKPEVITDLSLIYGDYYFVEALLRYKLGLRTP